MIAMIAQAVEIDQETHAQVGGVIGGDVHTRYGRIGIPGGHALSARADRHVGRNDIGNVGQFFPGKYDGIQVIDVLVADKHHNVREGADLFLAQLPVFGQLHILSAPVIKYQQGIAARDGETAVVVMNDGISGTQKNCHLHGRKALAGRPQETPVIMKNTGISIMKPPGRKAAETNV